MDAVAGTGPGTTEKENTVSIHADPLFITAEVERRLELAGVTPDGRDPVTAPAPLPVHPLAGLVARLVGGTTGGAPTRSARRTVATRRPRHP